MSLATPKQDIDLIKQRFKQNLPGLLPLLPLTEEGNRREVVQQMFRLLQQVEKKDLLAIAYRFAMLMLKEIH